MAYQIQVQGVLGMGYGDLGDKEISVLRTYYDKWRIFYRQLHAVIARLMQRIPWIEYSERYKEIKIRILENYNDCLHESKAYLLFEIKTREDKPLGELDFHRTLEKGWPKDEIALLLEVADALKKKWMVMDKPGHFIGLHLFDDTWLIHYFPHAKSFVKKGGHNRVQ